MRIIDKNYDFYDYLQDPTDTIVFDRRGSFSLSKEMICDAIYIIMHGRNDIYHHILLQCGAMFWVFLLNITHYKNNSIYLNSRPDNYDLRLIAKWKNYEKQRELLKLTLVKIPAPYLSWHYKDNTTTLNEELIDASKIQEIFDIYAHSVTTRSVLSNHSSIKYGGSLGKKYTYPLLSACGIANLVDPVDIFCAIEEHLSLEKSALERTEPLGVTNNDKIIMHGFDTQTSFRGKQKRG